MKKLLSKYSDEGFSIGEKSIKRINDFINENKIVNQKTLYRGLKDKPESHHLINLFKEKLNKNEIFYLNDLREKYKNNFSSWSKKKEIAEGFSGCDWAPIFHTDAFLLNIKKEKVKGLPISEFIGDDDEGEVLISKDAKFRILKIKNHDEYIKGVCDIMLKAPGFLKTFNIKKENFDFKFSFYEITLEEVF
jgi:hypothetical protein